MKWRSWLARLLRQCGVHGTLDTEQAIRKARMESHARDYQQGYAEGYQRGITDGQQRRTIYTLEPLPSMWIDESKRKHVQIQMSTYESPERTTEKPAVIPDARGRYFQHRRKEFEETRLMPSIRKPRLVHAKDEPPGPDDTRYDVPAFLEDRVV